MRSASGASRGPWGAAFFLIAAQSAACYAAPGGDLEFERVFSAAGEPAELHYKASYQDVRGRHELEVWRDGTRRLRRRTDGTLDLYVVAERDGDLSVAVLDHVRRMRTDISRSSLYQLGQFSDWFGLAHSFGKPLRPYALRLISPPPTAVAAVTPCQWYRLDADPQHAAICWSRTYRLPALIADAGGQVRWRLTSVDRDMPDAKVFDIADKGYIQVDADHDIKAD